MALKSFDYCPFCLRRVELCKQTGNGFRCPDCECQFRHDLRRWLPMAIPSALALVLMPIKFTHPDAVPWSSILILSAIGGVAVFVTPWPPYTVTKPGRPEMDARES